VPARAHMREIGRDHLSLAVELVAREAPRRLDDGFGVRAAGGKGPTTRTTSRIRRACARGQLLRFGYVVPCYVHGAALRLQEGDHRPDLLWRELPGHDRHDRLIARHDERGRIVERLVQMLLAALAGFPLAAAGADRSGALLVREEIGRARAEPVAGGAAADAVEHLLSRRHQPFGR